MPPKRKAQRAEPTDEDDVDNIVEEDLSDQEVMDRLKDNFSLSAIAAKDRQMQRADAASYLFRKSDQGDFVLKPDHANRPLWITNDGTIILESFNPLFPEAQDFLINIAEPQSRVSRMHEYKLTSHSLFAAISVGHPSRSIIERLSRYSKTALSPSVIAFIEKSTSSFGKAKLVLKHTLSYVESDDPDVLKHLMDDPVIAGCRADKTAGLSTEAAPKIGMMAIPGTKLAAGASQIVPQPPAPVTEEKQPKGPQNPTDMIESLREEDDDEEVSQVHSFQINSEDREKVIKRCQEINLPLTEEYDYQNDELNPNLKMDLKGEVQIRDYQEKALHKMFANSRARSGIIVLPCGAGKTLVGITAASLVKKSAIVLCTSGMSAQQWRQEFLKWTNIDPEDIKIFTSENKDTFTGKSGIIISTYTMITASREKRAYKSEEAMQFIGSREWGLLIADEVHVVPANIFKKVTYSIASHCKLGLTATLLREDDKIGDLNFLIGPKLYEANWQELSEQGHIARVQCAEVWCQMTPEFYQEWLKPSSSMQKRALLAIMNPRKFQSCQFLIDYHESRGDKIIVFSDNVFALEKYARKLNKAFIYGKTPQAERMAILQNFQHNPLVNTIFLSKIGDTSLDLPEATCLIQISSHYGSRRQEAQRLGRILRAKRRNDEGFNAFFYSLVSKDTDEMFYSGKRQAFLVDQGYAFKVITKLQGMESKPDLAFNTPSERREILSEVIIAKDEDLGEENIQGDMFSSKFASKGRGKKGKGARRTGATLSELSGGQGMAYVEQQKSRNKEIKSKTVKNTFMRRLQSSHQNAKKAKLG
jgi:DNA excision repair protein ERCC-3